MQMFFETAQRVRSGLFEPVTSQHYAGDEAPLRSDLFSAEQMQQHGKTLAGWHTLSTGDAPDHLLSRLAENEAVLIDVRNLVAEAVQTNRRITPAGEWLLDNFYLIEEQIRMAKRHLPKGYSRELPRLSNGPSAGLPRVYDIALEIISHGDGRVDPESLSSFVAAYQTVTALKLGELWAIPIMLRLALIENLRRAGTRIAARPDRPEPRPRMGGPDDGDCREGSQEPDFGHRGHGALRPSDGELHLWRSLPADCRDKAPPWPAPHLDRAATVRIRAHDRATGAVRDPTTGH